MIFWITIFIVSLFFLVKGADLFLVSAEKIGLALGLSPFIIGVTIVAFGTSFPELFASIVAAFKGITEFIPANAIGSNIANILLVVGISAIVGKKLTVTKNLIDVDLPLLAIGTAILFVVIMPWGDEKIPQITRPESILLVLTYVFYLLYTLFHKDEKDSDQETLPNRRERRGHIIGSQKEEVKRPKIALRDYGILVLGVVFLTFGAKFLIDSIESISYISGIGVGVISILGVAFGTSLPELIVSVKAAFQNKPEVALGNIFGSNIFNSFVVIGLPGIFVNIKLDSQTFLIGVPIMILATLLFVISGISRRIHNWEGIFFISLYILFVGKILNLF